MPSALTLADFQRAAVDQILTRLRNKQGSQRFLLADEVGLGKTIVARGVIEELAKRKRTPLQVIYLCSNAEIAEQNRRKLVADAGQSINRVTELAVRAGTGNSNVALYAFTPGTSLANGTGLAWERRLLLFLVHRLYDVDVSDMHWRRFFRCSAGEERWYSATKSAPLEAEFSRRTRKDFQDQLRTYISALPESSDIRPAALRAAVDSFDEADRAACRGRNRIVAHLRSAVQRIALRALQPDLVLLDEVQRFKAVIDEAKDQRQLSSELFKSRTPVLILSATPYRLLTLEHEKAGGEAAHHEDFFRTLDFLFGRDRKTPKRVRANLETFGKRLRQLDLTAVRDDALLSLKRKIEGDIRQVVSRTERNAYVGQALRGVAESGVHHRSLPNLPELQEYFSIHRDLGRYLPGAGQVTDFWKSTPSLLSFMDRGYALTRKLKLQKTRVPRGLLSSPDDPALPSRNPRLRQLILHALGADGTPPLLWTAPQYTYHKDRFYERRPARKMLLFSGWRFVPKSVALIVSQAADARLGAKKDEAGQPLRFAETRSFHVFDVCFPSWELARLVNPRAPRLDLLPGAFAAEDVLDSAVAILRMRLEEVGVSVAPVGKHPMWQAVARLEISGPHASAMLDGLGAWEGSEDASADATERHRDWFLNWCEEQKHPLTISEGDLRRMALVASFSPAIALLRALHTVYGAAELESEVPRLLTVTLETLRRFYNRPLNQRVVRTHKQQTQWKLKGARGKGGYAERVLVHAADAHLQAVLDEHTYLLRNAGGSDTIGRAIEHYGTVWALGRGSRKTNGPSGHGELVRIKDDAHVFPTHFALAFDDDRAIEAEPLDGEEQALRRTVVREAFNSPFWPFVLATTSVGQEGLDFHLHCRDVFHWNLPSNPVDLEQREGRINRRDCLAVRSSIARDWPIASMAEGLQSGAHSPWTLVFDCIAQDQNIQRYKHGLYPHWIYECKDPSHSVAIERHVAFFDASRDERRYAKLKEGLALYRLVFGQVDQEHLLNDLEQRLSELTEPERLEAKRRLSSYMLNLSPIGAGEALKFSHEEAKKLLDSSDPNGLQVLCNDVVDILTTNAAQLAEVRDDIERLLMRVRKAATSGERRSHQLVTVVTALTYLRNPYDEFFDTQSFGGFDDDLRVIRNAAKRLR